MKYVEVISIRSVTVIEGTVRIKFTDGGDIAFETSGNELLLKQLLLTLGYNELSVSDSDWSDE